jgi:tetratricopeptide (TPR) repeat protein
MALDGFRRLLEALVRRDRATAGQAWDELTALDARTRRELFRAAAGGEGELDVTVARFFLLYGRDWFSEMRAVLAPLERRDLPAIWQLVAAQLATWTWAVDDKPANPFRQLRGGEVLSQVKSHETEIQEWLASGLSRSGPPLRTVVTGLLAAPSPELVRFLLSLIVGPTEDEAHQTMLCLCAHQVATQVVEERYDDSGEEGSAFEQIETELGRCLADASLELNVRAELAEVARVLPALSYVAPLRSLMAAFERAGMANDGLTEAYFVVERFAPPDVKPAPALDAGEVVGWIYGIASQSSYRDPAQAAAGLVDGGTVLDRGDDGGGKRTLRFTDAVVQTCIRAFEVLVRQEDSVAPRYLAVLGAALGSSGRHDTALECAAIGAEWAVEENELEHVLVFVRMARDFRRQVAAADPRPLDSVIVDAVRGGQAAEQTGAVTVAQALYEGAVELAHGFDQVHEAAALGQLGVLYLKQGRRIEARAKLEAALVLQRLEGPDRANLATTLMELSIVERELENYEKSRQLLSQALTICEELEGSGANTPLAPCLYNMARHALEDGSESKLTIREWLERALHLSEAQGLTGLQVDVLEMLQSVRSDEKRPDLALNLSLLQTQLEARAGASIVDHIRAALGGAANSERAARFSEDPEPHVNHLLNQLVEAQTCLAYLEQQDALFFGIDNVGLKKQLANVDGERVLSRTVELLLARGEADWAYEFVARSKARAFLNLCGAARLDLLELLERKGIAAGHTAAIRKAARALIDDVHDGTRSGTAADAARHAELERLLQGLPDDFTGLLNANLAARDYSEMLRERRAHAEYARQISAGARVERPPISEAWLSTRLVPEIAAHLRPGERLIEFFLMPHGAAAFVLDPHGRVSATELNAGISEIRSWRENLSLQDWREQSTLPDWGPFLETAFSGLLRGPLTAIQEAGLERETVERLILVPHGPMADLPFAAMRNRETGRYLLEDFELVVLPSAGMVPVLRASSPALPSEFRMAVMGDAAHHRRPLTHAAREIEQAGITGIEHGGRVVVTKGAMLTPSRFIDEYRGSDVVHYCGHVVHDWRAPLRSFIPLAGSSAETEQSLSCQDFLRAVEGRNYLVFLNGCESGRTDMDLRNEPEGFLLAVLLSGARNFVHSVWPVADRAETVEIVSTFYAQVLGERVSCASALRASVQPFIRLHPVVWGGFQVAGLS